MAKRRNEAVINEQLDLRMYFRRDDSGTLYDPYEITKVEIVDAETREIQETITSITKLSEGDYQVITSSGWNTSARSVNDIWYTREVSGGPVYTSESSCVISDDTPEPSTGLPTADDIRSYLEGYGISSSIVSDSWIDETILYEVVPFVESVIKTSLTEETTAVEYYSGNGRDTLILNRRFINSIVKIELVTGVDYDNAVNLNNIDIIADQGILKAKITIDEFFKNVVFPKGNRNIKVTYKYGGNINNELRLAIKMLSCIPCLDLIEGRTGGGDLQTQCLTKNYGKMGKYTNIRIRLSNRAMAILRRYWTMVSGQ